MCRSWRTTPLQCTSCLDGCSSSRTSRKPNPPLTAALPLFKMKCEDAETTSERRCHSALAMRPSRLLLQNRTPLDSTQSTLFFITALLPLLLLQGKVRKKHQGAASKGGLWTERTCRSAETNCVFVICQWCHYSVKTYFAVWKCK